MKTWLGRELTVFETLTSLGLPIVSINQLVRFESLVTNNNQRYIPPNLSREILLIICQLLGLPIKQDSSFSASCSDIAALPTEEGLLECNLAKLLQVADSDFKPACLNYDQQSFWSSQQGGSLPSVEEHLYLILRSQVELKVIPFAGYQCRCRNEHLTSPEDTGIVTWTNTDNLHLTYGHKQFRGWQLRTWPRLFTALASS